MVKTKPIIILLSVIAISTLAFVFFFKNEERQVKKQFKTFAKTASIHVEDSQLIVAGKSKKISKFFTETCRIEAHEFNVSRNYSQKDIHTISFQAFTRYSELTLTFVDLHVEIPGKGIAIALSTVRIIGKAKGKEEYIEENYEIKCRLNKIDDEWFFVKVELIDVLKK